MNILIIQNRPGIGDQCLYLKYFHEISQSLNTKITLLTRKRSLAKVFLRDDNHLKEIKYFEELNNSKIQLYKWISKKKFHKTFIFHYGLKFPFIAKIAGSNEVSFYGIIKKKTNIVTDGYNFTLNCLNKSHIDSEFKFVGEIPKLKNNDLIIGIGGSGYQKKWSISRYVNLINSLYKLSKFRLILAGGIKERLDAEEIRKGVIVKDILSLCDLDLSSCLKYIKTSKLYIGNDTGFMHLSAGYGLKSFGIFGDTPNSYASYTKNIFPIIPEGYKFVTHNTKAMDKIHEDYVLNKVKNEFINLFK